MPDLMLRRVDHRAWGVYGVFIGPNGPFLVTLELPWKDNQKKISHIPAGVYRLKRVISPKFGETFEITGVPGRDKVLVHWGNTTKDSHGCVLVGNEFEEFAAMGGKNGTAGSKDAFQEFMQMLAKDTDVQLTVTDF